MVAEARDIDSGRVAGFDDRLALRGLDFDPVDGEAEGFRAHSRLSCGTGSRPWISTASRKASCNVTSGVNGLGASLAS